MGATLAERVVATLSSPRALGALIRERPAWLDVLALSTAVAIASAAMLPAEGLVEGLQDPVNRRGAPVEITSPPSEIVRWGRYLAMLSALVGHPLIAFVLAGLLALIFGVIARGRASFPEYLSLSSHALIIAGLGMLVAVVLQHLTGDPDAYPSLAAAAPFLRSGSTVRDYLELINPFTLWMIVVLGLGVAALEPRLSRPVPTVVLLGGYLVIAAGVAVWTG